MSNSQPSSIDIVIPDIGDSQDVEIIELLVSAGDAVVVDDSLLTLESDKASMEVPALHEGTIQSLKVQVGDTVNSGDVIGTLSVADAETSTSPVQESAAPQTAGTSASDKQNNSSATQAIADTTHAQVPAHQSGDGAAQTQPDTANSPISAPADAPSANAGGSPPATRSASPTAHISDESIRKAHAGPGVRRYAREHGADLSLIQGTGPKGRIIKADVITFIKSSMEGMGGAYAAPSANAGQGAGIPPIPEVDFSKFGDVERVELSRINKLSAANLHRAWLNLPMVTHHDQADITDMEAFRKQLKSETQEGEAKVTGLAFHMKALVQTLRAFPRLNSSLSSDGEALFYKKYFHIGIAVDTPNGLVVPVFRDVDKKSIRQLAAEMADMSSRAREKKLKPDEMQGASMTISSLGGIGGTQFTPIVNPPEVAILGITKATMQPVWNGQEFIPRLMCPLDLTYDHRVVDGADAARFMAYYSKQISDVRRLTL